MSIRLCLVSKNVKKKKRKIEKKNQRKKKKFKIKQILNNFKNINFFCRTFSSPNIVLKFIHFLITKRCVKVRESPSCLLITKHCVKVHPWFSRNPIMSTLLLYQNYD